MCSRSKVGWPRIGLLIIEVERTQAWRVTPAPSFSRWLEMFAQSLNIPKAVCWRYRTAARFYLKLLHQPRHRNRYKDNLVPPLTGLPPQVSAESLELLAKLSRVIPDSFVADLGDRLLGGRLRREELRRTWQVARRALGGRTARGPLGDIPHASPSSTLTVEAIRVAQISHAVAVNHEWTGYRPPAVYEVFTDVRADLPTGPLSECTIDIVVIVRSSTGPAEIHGIVIPDRTIPPKLTEHLTLAMQLTEYTWIAAHWYDSKIEIPAEIGQLVLTGPYPTPSLPSPDEAPAWHDLYTPRRATMQRAPYQPFLLKGLLLRALRGQTIPLSE